MGKALMEDLPYPDLSNIGPDLKAARILSPAYAAAGSELTAILQYIFHGFQFGHKNMPDYAELMTDIAIAEMRHLDLLGETLLRLGANRRLRKNADAFGQRRRLRAHQPHNTGRKAPLETPQTRLRRSLQSLACGVPPRAAGCPCRQWPPGV